MDTFTIGREIGEVKGRLTSIEGRMTRFELRLKQWQKLARRFILVALLWSIAAMGIVNRDEASNIAAAVIKKAVISALTGI
tara:strand:- start:165 stop:407 length:243 start_codon:yes stop_codon:yes gene_type:complete